MTFLLDNKHKKKIKREYRKRLFKHFTVLFIFIAIVWIMSRIPIFLKVYLETNFAKQEVALQNKDQKALNNKTLQEKINDLKNKHKVIENKVFFKNDIRSRNISKIKNNIDNILLNRGVLKSMNISLNDTGNHIVNINAVIKDRESLKNIIESINGANSPFKQVSIPTSLFSKSSDILLNIELNYK